MSIEPLELYLITLNTHFTTKMSIPRGYSTRSHEYFYWSSPFCFHSSNLFIKLWSFMIAIRFNSNKTTTFIYINNWYVPCNLRYQFHQQGQCHLKEYPCWVFHNSLLLKIPYRNLHQWWHHDSWVKIILFGCVWPKGVGK